MNVPPFIPQPIEIPGNVSEEPRAVFLVFVRRAVTLHFASALCVVGIAFLPVAPLPLEFCGTWLLGVLVLLSIVRNTAKGRPVEFWLSVGISPALLVVMGLSARVLWDLKWPVWALGAGLFFSVVYTWLSGRDHSFVGQYVLSLIASTVFIVIVQRTVPEVSGHQTAAVVGNAVFLFYFVYDLAAIVTRRRKGEELAAVVDLYRDFLNGLTYSVRVWRHWQKHKIWSLPQK
jgi:FtsH-binding integral membrane protein